MSKYNEARSGTSSVDRLNTMGRAVNIVRDNPSVERKPDITVGGNPAIAVLRDEGGGHERTACESVPESSVIRPRLIPFW